MKVVVLLAIWQTSQLPETLKKKCESNFSAHVKLTLCSESSAIYSVNDGHLKTNKKNPNSLIIEALAIYSA